MRHEERISRQVVRCQWSDDTLQSFDFIWENAGISLWHLLTPSHAPRRYELILATEDTAPGIALGIALGTAQYLGVAPLHRHHPE